VSAPSPLREKAGMRGDITCDFILLSPRRGSKIDLQHGISINIFVSFVLFVDKPLEYF